MAIENVKIEKFKVKEGAGMPQENYARITYKNEEIGFVNDEGIYLRMENPCCRYGVMKKIELGDDKPFNQKCLLLEKHWLAIYDRYTLTVRGK